MGSRTPWLVAMTEQDRTRTGVNEEHFVQTLDRACDALDGCGVPFLFMGGIASIVHGRTSWTHDLDVFVRRADEPTVVEALERAGFERDPAPSSWLTKLWHGDVYIDVINTSTGPIYLDDEMLARGEKAEVWSRTLTVLGPEDLVVTKALAHGEETAHYWWDALAIIAGHELDWDYLLMRARRGPRRVLSLLLYAQSTDLAVPDPVVRQLSAVTLGDVEPVTARLTPRTRYLAGHLHEALLTDARVGEQDLDVASPTRAIHVSGAVATPARRDAIEAVIAEQAPGWQRAQRRPRRADAATRPTRRTLP